MAISSPNLHTLGNFFRTFDKVWVIFTSLWQHYRLITLSKTKKVLWIEMTNKYQTSGNESRHLLKTNRAMILESWQVAQNQWPRVVTISQNRDAGTKNKINQIGAVVVSDLVEWSLPTPEIRGSNQKNCMHYQLYRKKLK